MAKQDRPGSYQANQQQERDDQKNRNGSMGHLVKQQGTEEHLGKEGKEPEKKINGRKGTISPLLFIPLGKMNGLVDEWINEW